MAQLTVKREYRERMRSLTYTIRCKERELHRPPASLIVSGGWKEKACGMVGLWSLPWYPHSGQAVGQASQEVSAAITTVDPAESPSEVEP